mgnify:CR=1 FL=1
MIESFPRMWDQRKPFTIVFVIARIIPTYVGSTGTPGSGKSFHANHSHVCGINAERAMYAATDGESFPRMWDQLLLVCCFVLSPRIIPTYVGSTVKVPK